MLIVHEAIADDRELLGRLLDFYFHDFSEFDGRDIEGAHCGVGQTVVVEKQPPAPRPWEASDEEAVELCREWMVYLGAADTVAAVGEARRMCDLYSGLYVAWVDNRLGNLDVDLVEKAAILAAADGRRALIFVASGVRPVAQDLADAIGVALLRYGAHGGVLDGANTLGRQLCASGLISK